MLCKEEEKAELIYIVASFHIVKRRENLRGGHIYQGHRHVKGLEEQRTGKMRRLCKEHPVQQG